MIIRNVVKDGPDPVWVHARRIALYKHLNKTEDAKAPKSDNRRLA